jgi:hypothetical protein
MPEEEEIRRDDTLLTAGGAQRLGEKDNGDAMTA